MPSAERDRTKTALRQRWRQQDLADLRREAEVAYRSFLADPGAASTGRSSPRRR